jgi:hypothetical protein
LSRLPRLDPNSKSNAVPMLRANMPPTVIRNPPTASAPLTLPSAKQRGDRDHGSEGGEQHDVGPPVLPAVELAHLDVARPGVLPVGEVELLELRGR